MKNLFNKAATTAASIVVLVAGAVIAVLGLTVFAMLALFGLAIGGLALLTAPFLIWAQNDHHDFETAPEPQPAA